jgi:asparagine synthase (glutamine-hydrolysing)
MCGIGGCVVPAGQGPPTEALHRMRDALAHRGPDGDGIEVEGNVGLVHTRLAIVDPSPAGSQPMRHPGGRWLLSYNGEVFNHADLRRELGEAGFQGQSDTETVLHSLARWREEAVHRFNGLFAFAALDLERNRLLLVRDRFGVKPLYLALHRGALWFASEIGALLAAGIPAAPARAGILRAIDRSFTNGPETVIEGIGQVPPGTTVSIDLERLTGESARWYDPARAVDPERQAELERRSRDELVALLERELLDSVQRRLMADVPIGTTCSGGVDSSIVTALAREARPDLVAFSVATPDYGRLDEGPAAARTAAALGIELVETPMTASSWRAAFVAATRHFGQPLANASAIGIANMAAAARERGVKALLTGEGSDELFGGYLRLHRGEYRGLLSRRDRFTRVGEAARLVGPRGLPAAALRRIGIARPPPPLLRLGDGAAAAWDNDAREAARSAYRHHAGQQGALESELLSELSIALPQLLNRMDKNAMQHSVEARLPFLDPGVVSLVLNLPLRARVAPRSKGILRDVARRHLPRRTAHRPKVFGMEFGAQRWLEGAAAPSFLGDGLLREVLAVPGERWQAFVAGVQRSQAIRLWSAEAWCRMVLDGQSDAAVERELWPHGP